MVRVACLITFAIFNIALALENERRAIQFSNTTTIASITPSTSLQSYTDSSSSASTSSEGPFASSSTFPSSAAPSALPSSTPSSVSTSSSSSSSSSTLTYSQSIPTIVTAASPASSAFSTPASTVTANSTTAPPSVTAPPNGTIGYCCSQGHEYGVGLVVWYTGPSVEITVATVISIYAQYNNTRVLESVQTVNASNATSIYGDYNRPQTLSGLPTTLVPFGENLYGKTVIGAATEIVFPHQSLTITSPTPFYYYPEVGFFTGLSTVGQTEQTCSRPVYTVAEGRTFTSTIGGTAVTSTTAAQIAYTDWPRWGPDDDEFDVTVKGPFAMIYKGNLSDWLCDKCGGGGGQAEIANPDSVVELLADNPYAVSQFPLVGSCMTNYRNDGSPTVHVPVSELTHSTESVITRSGIYTEITSSTSPITTPTPNPNSCLPDDETCEDTSGAHRAHTEASESTLILPSKEPLSKAITETTASTLALPAQNPVTTSTGQPSKIVITTSITSGSTSTTRPSIALSAHTETKATQLDLPSPHNDDTDIVSATANPGSTSSGGTPMAFTAHLETTATQLDLPSPADGGTDILTATAHLETSASVLIVHLPSGYTDTPHASAIIESTAATLKVPTPAGSDNEPGFPPTTISSSPTILWVTVTTTGEDGTSFVAMIESTATTLSLPEPSIESTAKTFKVPTPVGQGTGTKPAPTTVQWVSTIPVQSPSSTSGTGVVLPPVILPWTTVTPDASSNYDIGSGQTLTPNGPAVTHDGSTYAISTGTSGAVFVSNGVSSVLVQPTSLSAGTGAKVAAPVPAPAITIGSVAVTQNSASQYVIPSTVAGTTSDQTLNPGGSGVVVAGTTYSIPSAGTAVVINGHTSVIATPAGAVVTLGSNTASGEQNVAGAGVLATPVGSAGAYVVSGQTISAGGSAAVIAGTTYSLVSSGSSKAVVVNGQTSPITAAAGAIATFGSIGQSGTSGAGVLATPLRGNGGYIVAGQTLSPGGSAAVIAGITYSLVSSGSSTAVVINGQTSPITAAAGATATFGSSGESGAGVLATPVGSSGEYVAAGQTLSPGGSAVVLAGTTYSLVPSSSSSPEAVVINGVTTPLPTAGPSLAATGAALYNSGTATSISEYLIAGQTLLPAGPALTISGTTISLAQDGSTVYVNGIATSLLHSNQALTIAGVEATPTQAPAYIISGQTVLPGGPALTISGTTYSLPAAATALLINGISSPLPTAAQRQVITLGGKTYTISHTVVSGTTALVIGTQTLSPGSMQTINGVPVSLAPDGNAILVAGSQATSTVDGVAAAIMSILNMGAASPTSSVQAEQANADTSSASVTRSTRSGGVSSAPDFSAAATGEASSSESTAGGEGSGAGTKTSSAGAAATAKAGVLGLLFGLVVLL